MLLLIYYIAAITTITLHFTGMLQRYNLDWLLLVLGATVFPAVFYL